MKKRFLPKVLTVLCILGAVLCLLAGAVFGKLVRPNILLAQGLEKVGFLAVYGHGSAGRLRRHIALC